MNYSFSAKHSYSNLRNVFSWKCHAAIQQCKVSRPLLKSTE